VRPAQDAEDDEEVEGSQKAITDKAKSVETPNEVKVLTDKDHFNRLIGPIKVNLEETTIEQVYETLDSLLKSKETQLSEYFNAGFELFSKYRSLEEIRQLRGVHDWRQLVIKKKEPLPPPEPVEGENPEGDGDEEPQDDD